MIGDYIAKPKGMHQATFDRKMAKVAEAEAIVGPMNERSWKAPAGKSWR